MICAEGAIKKQGQKAKREALSPVASATPGNRQSTISRKPLLSTVALNFALSTPTKEFCHEFLQLRASGSVSVLKKGKNL
jgi:hypothetical protein